MDAFASPSIRAKPPAYRGGSVGGTLAAALILGLSLVGGFMGSPDSTLDASWQEMLIHAHAAGLQFGRDVIFTWGPWGFLCNGYHLGGVEALPILAWQVGGQILIGALLAVLTRQLVPWRRVAFVAAFLAFHWLFADTAYFVLIALIAVSALMDREASVPGLIAWTLILGFLSQLKFTYLILSSAAVLASIGCWAGRRSWTRAAAVACGYAASVAVAWISAGQALDNLYPYLRRSLEISSGYADAMQLDESWATFVAGSLLALLCVFFTRSVWRTVPERALGASASAFLAFSMYVMWKESFIRADQIVLGGHVFGFFTYILILGPVLPGLLLPGARRHWFDASFPFCLLALAFIDPGLYSQAPRVLWERLYGSARTLRHIGQIPAEWQRAREKAEKAESLPAVRAAVGEGTVDVYDFNGGKAVLNHLRLSTRPIFQSYSAYTPSLEGWNLRYYQSDRAPDYLLWSDAAGMDRRYPGQDDARLLAALPGHYQPVLSEGGYWLFRKTTPVSREPMALTPILRQSMFLGDELVLTAPVDHAVWIRVVAHPNTLGRLRALLYKPAQIDIVTTDIAGAQGTWRLLPRVAADGFILEPRLGGGADMSLLMRGYANSWVRSLHFDAPAGQAEFWGRLDVELFQVSGLPVHPVSPFIAWSVEAGIFDRPALSVDSAKPMAIVDEPEKALFLHAPGEVVLAVPESATRFRSGFGLRRGAYTDGGHTAGVEFSVDAEWASGRRERIWDRFLDPVSSPGDRGTQHLDLELPSDLPTRLVLRTGVAPNKDDRWDWSYVCGLSFAVPAQK